MTGRIVLVTGADRGTGFEVAVALAGRGAEVTISGPDRARGEVAVLHARERSRSSAVGFAHLNLADLSDVRRFAESWTRPLDLLVANAGVEAIAHRRSIDGFELHLATNHLGHFALTGLLMPGLLGPDRSRVVVVSSLAQKLGRIHFDDLQFERHYGRLKAYAQSKLANMLFVRELQRRLVASSAEVLAVAAHPGVSATHQSAESTGTNWVFRLASSRLIAATSQSAHEGALPILYAAGMPDVTGGEFYGPSGRGEIRGGPARVKPSRAARDDRAAFRLWTVSQELTGVSYL